MIALPPEHLASLQYAFHIGWNYKPLKVRISVAMAVEKLNTIITGVRQHRLDVRCILNQCFVCVCVWTVSSLLIKYKGPAALLCWFRYCWGLIWLSGPLPSKAAELCFICGSDGAWPSLCIAWPFIWKRKQIWPLSLSPSLSVCPSACHSLSHALLLPSVCHFRLSLSLLFVFASLLSSVFLIAHLAFCILSSVAPLSPHTHTYTCHYSSISPTHLLS